MRTSLDMSCEIRSVSINHKPKTIYLLPSAEREGGFPRLPSVAHTYYSLCLNITFASTPTSFQSHQIAKNVYEKEAVGHHYNALWCELKHIPCCQIIDGILAVFFLFFFFIFWFLVFRFFFTNGIGNNAIYIIYSSFKMANEHASFE